MLRLTGSVTRVGDSGEVQGARPGPNTAPTVAGRWSAALETPHGKMAVTFELKLDGKTVTGTFTSEQTGALPIKGQYVTTSSLTRYRAVPASSSSTVS